MYSFMSMGLGKRQTPRGDDHYNDNGVLICGSCGKPREWHGVWPGIGKTWACCSCDCDINRYKKEQEETQNAQKRLAVKMHREWAFPLGSELNKITFGKDDGTNDKVSRAVRKYADNLEKNLKEGKNLLLWGKVGTGKTFFAAAVLNAAIDEGYKCLFTSFPQVINELSKTMDKNGYLNEIRSYDFIVFDDFGIERDTEYVNEQIYQIVNARYLSGKPMIITTNMGNQDFATDDMSKKRIISRILDKAVDVVMLGDDRRTIRYRH